LDYGLTEEELLIPERRGGTLRAYHRHRLNADVLASPGEQDITSHVNFSVLREIGESAGLETLAFVTQAQFLTGIASRAWSAQREFGDWTQESTRQFQTLTHPEFLGTRFRVLLQTAKPAPGEANS
jgi:SAM-dependent MidA family methyltransferase